MVQRSCMSNSPFQHPEGHHQSERIIPLQGVKVEKVEEQDTTDFEKCLSILGRLSSAPNTGESDKMV